MAYEPIVGFGTRHGRVYELDTDGFIKATSTAPYVGYKLYGIRSFALTPGAVRRIPHFDGDKVGITQIFPATDAPTGTITIDGSDIALNAILGNVLASTIGDFEMVPHLSDQQGAEPQVGLLVYQAAVKNTNAKGWHIFMIASTQAVPRPGQFGDANYETTYELAPSASGHHLFGKDLTLGAEGAGDSGLFEGWSVYIPMVTAWKADGVEDAFDFVSTLQAVDTTYPVYKVTAGVATEVTAGITKTTSGITLTAAPTNGDKLIALHGVAKDD